MADPFDPNDTSQNLASDPNFWHNLQTFGASTMQAANTYGPNGFLTYGAGPSGAIGVGLNAASQEARTNAANQANVAKTQAEAQSQRQQNQLFPLQMQMMRGQMQMMNGILGDQGGAQTPPNNPPSPSAGMVSSPNLSNGASLPQTTYRPSNNPGNLRPQGASTGFQSFATPEQGENALYKDLLSKIDGSSPAMQAKFGKDYQPTLANVITTYAPPNENDTPGYIQNIAKQSGIDPNQNLRASDLSKIVPLITKQEGNTPAPAAQSPSYEQQIQPTPQEKSYVAMDKFMPGIGKIGEAQYQARIAPIKAAAEAQATVQATGNKKTAEETASNLADSTKSFNAAYANTPRAMERFEELRRAAPLASSGGWGTGEDKDDPGLKIRMAQSFSPETANANNTISQISSQGILPEVGPVIQATGGRGNQFMERMAASASGIKLADPSNVKINSIQNVEDQYVANLKSLAQQRRAYGDTSAPSDQDIDSQIKQSKNIAQARMDAKDAITSGAPRNAVIRRLNASGIDTSGL